LEFKVGRLEGRIMENTNVDYQQALINEIAGLPQEAFPQPLGNRSPIQRERVGPESPSRFGASG
jgi:hypothetical protein